MAKSRSVPDTARRPAFPLPHQTDVGAGPPVAPKGHRRRATPKGVILNAWQFEQDGSSSQFVRRPHPGHHRHRQRRGGLAPRRPPAPTAVDDLIMPVGGANDLIMPVGGANDLIMPVGGAAGPPRDRRKRLSF
jgi:hypothetical protein